MFLLPGCRALQSNAVGSGNGLRQLASLYLFSTDLKSSVSGLAELVGVSARRLGNHDFFVRKALTYKLYGRGQVAVCRDDQSGIKVVIEGIGDKLNRNIYIGHLFLIVGPAGPTAPTLAGFPQVVPVMNLQVVAREQRIKIVVLPLFIGVVVTNQSQPSCKIVGGFQRLAGDHECF